MTWIILFLFALSLAEGNVMTLTDANFKEVIEKNPIVMVKFYAPWCGHCKAFAPEYEKAAGIVKEKGLPYIIAEVDATVEKVTSDSQNIQGFPTVKLFYNGNPIDYDGERTADAVLTFIEKKTGPSSIELKNQTEIDNVKSNGKLRCIFVNTNEKDLETFMKVASANEEYTFYHADKKLIDSSFKGVEDAKAFILTSFSDAIPKLTDEFTEEKLKNFLMVEMLPTVNNVTQEVVEQVFKQEGRTGIMLFRSDDDTKRQLYEEYFETVAKNNKQKGYVFMVNNAVDDWGKRLSEYLGIEDIKLPILMIIDTKGELTKYLYSDEITVMNVEKFIKDYENKAVKVYYKSESIPTENPGPIYKVVSKNFNKEVIDNDDDIILKFYAPWCNHCKKLAPVFEKVANAMAVNKKLKFMEVDATKNDIEGHSISGFPVVKFFPGKNKSNFTTFEGERDEVSIAKYIKEHSSYDIIMPEFPADDDDGELGKDDL